MRVRPRRLAFDQACAVHVVDIATGTAREVYRTTERLLEAPNWIDADTLILNGDGVLWRLSIASGMLVPIDLDGVPDLNNDHVPAPDPDVMFVSANDWHIHRAILSTGATSRVTAHDPSRPMLHFLHGVSPDGETLAFVGVEPGPGGPWGSANIFTIPSAGGPIRQLTAGTRPADGCEYSPDGTWIYFNTEAFTEQEGHAQIARLRVDDCEQTQLTFDERVNWFPHCSPDGTLICHLSYPPGTTGHPADLDVEIRLVIDHDWSTPVTLARLVGGQGTINVNSWAPDSAAFAYVAYPVAGRRREDDQVRGTG